jgi:hypothetical protein
MPQLDGQGLMGKAEAGTDAIPEIPIAAMAVGTMATITLRDMGRSPGLPMKACASVANRAPSRLVHRENFGMEHQATESSNEKTGLRN